MGHAPAGGTQRRRWLPVAAACLLAAGPAIAHASSGAVQLVLDCSIATWGVLPDGTPGLVATRIAVDELAAGLADRGKERIGVRLMGASQPFAAPDACRDITLVLSPGPPSALGAGAILDRVTPRGRRPLLAAVVAAAADLDGASGTRRVVLVTAGPDDCDGDRAAAAAALRSGVELRVVGLGLDAASAAAFQGVAPTRNATSTAELVAALQWAVLGDEEERPTARVTVQVTRGGALLTGVTATLRRQATGQDFPMATDDHGFQTRVPPGRYALAVVDADGRRLAEREGIVLDAGASLSLTVEDPGAPPTATLEVNDGPWTAGDTVAARFAGAGPGRHWVTVVPAAAPGAAWTARVEVRGAAGTVRLPLPPRPDALELRLLHELADGTLEPLATTPLVVHAPEAELDVAHTAAPATPLKVGWKGPAQDGDEIVVAAAGAPPFARVASTPAAGGSPATLITPAAEGAYEVRYVNGVSGRILAESELEVAPVPIALEAPQQIGVGREFAVEATPEPPADSFLLLARPGAAPQDYLLWRPGGARVTLTAPHEPGTYEVRYVSKGEDEVLARVTVEVVPIPVRLEAPRQVAAGSRFQVTWTGPDGAGDFIDVARAGASRLRHLDWAYTAQGSPVDLAAPFVPGTYEVRYISGDDLEVLVRRQLKVR